MKINWYRLAILALGVASVTIGALVPPTATILMPTGTFLIGLGLRTPGDAPPPSPPPPVPAKC